MAREALPRLAERASKTGDTGPKGPTAVVEIPKGDGDGHEMAQLRSYQQMGYKIEDEGYYYTGTCDLAEMQARQKEYQSKGMRQAGLASKPEELQGDVKGREYTISNVSMQHGNVNARDILDELDLSGPVTP